MLWASYHLVRLAIVLLLCGRLTDIVADNSCNVQASAWQPASQIGLDVCSKQLGIRYCVCKSFLTPAVLLVFVSLLGSGTA